jgi:hypothetical protein
MLGVDALEEAIPELSSWLFPVSSAIHHQIQPTNKQVSLQSIPTGGDNVKL